VGDKLLLRLNIYRRPIAYKYCEGKMKRTLKRAVFQLVLLMLFYYGKPKRKQLTKVNIMEFGFLPNKGKALLLL